MLGTGDHSADAAVLTKTTALLGSLWGPETELMGEPLPDIPAGRSAGRFKAPADDDGNKTRRIDVYVVAPGQPVRRNGDDESISGTILAETVSTPTSSATAPHDARSGFMLMRLDQFSSPAFKSLVAHELFHLLQFAHNAKAAQTCTNAKWWFAEASATWAQSYFVPETAAAQVYQQWFPDFQLGSSPDATSWSMEDASGKYHPYESFIWPYFMQQEKGPRSIADMWKAADTATNCAELNADLDHVLPFARFFHDFALRNLDNSATFGIDPTGEMSPTYQDLHSDFPADESPQLTTGNIALVRSGQPPLTESVSIPPLRAWYYDLTVDPSVGQVIVDGGDLSPEGTHNLDAVENVNGTWVIRNLGPGQTTICTNPQDVSEIYLVVSNFSDLPTNTLHGDLRIASLPTSCGCPDYSKVTAYNGTASFSFSASASYSDDQNDQESISLEQSATSLGLNLTGNPSDPTNSSFTGSGTTGSVSVNDLDTFFDPGLPATSTANATANGAPDPTNSQEAVTFDPSACTYNVQITGAIATNYASTGPEPHPIDDGGITDVALSPTLPIPQGLSLSGSQSLPVYLSPPQTTQAIAGGYFTFPPTDSWAQEFATVDGAGLQGQLGTASFTWSLSPVMSSASDRRDASRRRYTVVEAAVDREGRLTTVRPSVDLNRMAKRRRLSRHLGASRPEQGQRRTVQNPAATYAESVRPRRR